MSPLHNGSDHRAKTNLQIYFDFASEVKTKQIAFVNCNYATLAPLYIFGGCDSITLRKKA